MPAYDTALNWNRAHPIGSPAIVTLANGQKVEDKTANGAVQWGSIGLVTLRNRPDRWPAHMPAALPVPVPVD